jgi:diguanylate cyclase (GGDEF)-like protein
LSLAPEVRTRLLGAVLIASAVGLFHGVMSASPPFAAQLTLTWWQLAPAFALAGGLVFHVEINSEAHTFSLSEVPFVLALFFTSPTELLLARLLGEAVTLVLYERQSGTKLGFNLSLFAAESCLALSIFHALLGAQAAPDLAAWTVALIAVGAAAGLGVVAVWAVIRWHGGHPNPRDLLLTAAITTLCNTSLASVAAGLLIHQRSAVVPLSVVAIIVVLAYRGYTRLSKRYAGLEMLYQFTRLTSGVARPQETIESVLDEARRMLRAELAAIVLLPHDAGPGLTLARRGEASFEPICDLQRIPALQSRVVERRETVAIARTSKEPYHREILAALDVRDCLVAPLLSAGDVMGVIIVGDRLGHVSTFDAEDARLFTTLSLQAGVALENGRLIDRLHEQARAREHEALHDALTGLPNRTLFARHVEEILGRPVDGPPRVAVLLMDLDRFKEVNDTLGHHTGDQLLQQVARRLLSAVGPHGMVARLGGDEFAVLLADIGGVTDALETAHRIYARITEPVPLASLLLDVGASIGIAIGPDHGEDLPALLQRADVAMYSCKGSRDRVAVYDPEKDWNSEVRLRLAGELRGALERHELEVHFQPIARVADGHVVKAEALARWRHAELGQLSPDDFIPIAERTGLIEDLTLYVLDVAVRQCQEWREAGLDLRVAVNLSVQVLLDADWPGKISDMLARHELPADRLMLEITESGIMSDPERMTAVLNQIAHSGVRFSIDDFGTGYSSLSYLQKLPISEVKIDKSFVFPMASDAGAASIVRSVVDLARSLNLTIVAEGVEDQRTLDQLAAIHCDYVQGYYLSRALPGQELTDWLSRRFPRGDRASEPAALR